MNIKKDRKILEEALRLGLKTAAELAAFWRMHPTRTL